MIKTKSKHPMHPSQYEVKLRGMQSKIKGALGREPKVRFSAYKRERNGLPADNLNEIPISGKVAIMEDVAYKVGEMPRCNPIMRDPAWLDICVEADKSIERSGDFHHVFLERVDVVGVFRDITLVQLVMGS